MASATNGGGSGGAAGGAAGVKISLRLQYYLVLAAAGVIVVVVSLAFMSPAAMVAVRQNLGATAAAADASGDRGGARPVLFNFGDSNSDTGGVAAAGGIRITPPEGRTHFHRPTGRLSDGRVIIDFICENLSTHHLNPYLKSVGSDYSNGVNFAMAGSTATHGFSPYSLNVQIDQFLYFKQRSLELFDQGLKGPVDKEGFERALYMMDIGHNDVSSVLHTPSEGWPQKFRDIVGEIKTAVKILYDNGARKFWIHGTGALGCLPAVVSQEKGARDAHGCLAAHNRGVMAFNRLLRDACADMRRRLDGAAVVYTDLFAIKYDLVANHTKYGIEWPLMACCGYGGPPYNMATGKSCSSPGGHLCAPGEKLTSWDGVHYTDYASGVAAGRVLSGEYSTPNIKLASLVHGSNATSDS